MSNVNLQSSGTSSSHLMKAPELTDGAVIGLLFVYIITFSCSLGFDLI